MSVRKTIAITKTDVKNSQITYVGETTDKDALTSQPKWQLRRILTQGNLTTETFGNNQEFNQIFDNRDDGIIFPVPTPPPYTDTKSVLFGGADEYVVVGDVGNFERTDAFSASFWFKTSNAGAMMIISRQTNSGLFPGWNIFIEAGKIKVALINNNGTANRLFIETNSTFNDGTWHHCLMTYAGTSNTSGLLTYIDGSLAAITVLTNALSASILTSANFQISGRDGPNVVLTGNVNEVALYDRVLTASEVTDIYNSGSSNDLSLLTTSGDLLNWWRMGDNDSFPTLFDNKGTKDATMVNMESGDIVLDVSS